MSLDGYLTFLALLVAIGSMLGPIQRQRVRRAWFAFLLLQCFAFFAVLYIEHTQTSIDVPQIGNVEGRIANFIIVVVCSLSSIVWFSVRKAHRFDLAHVCRLAADFLNKRRFDDFYELLLPYLPVVAEFSRSGGCGYCNKVEELVVSSDVVENLVFNRGDFAYHCISAIKPRTYPILSELLKRSAVSSKSLIRQDLVRLVYFSGGGNFFPDEKSCLSWIDENLEQFLKRLNWKKFHDGFAMQLERDVIYRASLSHPCPRYDENLLDDLTFAFVLYLDFIVEAAKRQGIMNDAENVLEFYSITISDILKACGEAKRPPSDDCEFPNLAHYLIYEAYNRQFDLMEDVLQDIGAGHAFSKDERGWRFTASTSLAESLRKILRANCLSDRFKIERLERFLGLYGRAMFFPESGQEIREFLSDCIGLNYFTNEVRPEEAGWLLEWFGGCDTECRFGASHLENRLKQLSKL